MIWTADIRETVEEGKVYSRQKDESRHGDSNAVQSRQYNSETHEFIGRMKIRQ